MLSKIKSKGRFLETKNLHFTLKGETRRAPGPPVTRAQMAWEDADKVRLAVSRYFHRQPWTRAA
jgi:hypothetical protein